MVSSALTGRLGEETESRPSNSKTGWKRHDNGVTQTLTAISAAAYWYPSPRRALYLKGGVGLVTHHAEDAADVKIGRASCRERV